MAARVPDEAANESAEVALARLLDENAALRAQLDAASAPRPPRTRAWGWTVLATALIVIGSLLAPVGIIANWARYELTDTNAFVTTFAPLSKDPAVRAFVARETVKAVNNRVDLDGVTDDLFDGLAGLDLPPRAATALGLLKAPAKAGAQSLITSTVDRFVASKQFSNLWRQMLQTGHVQAVATLSGDKKSIVAIGDDGAIGIQLSPVIAKVKSLLVKQGFTLAENIPAVNRTIVLATNTDAVKAQRGYALVIALGTWLPWVALVFLIVGVVVARRRSLALFLAALALGASMLLTLAGISIGRAVAVRHLSPDLVPADAAHVIYAAVVAFMISSATAVAVLAFAVAVVAWFAGSSRPATRVRAAASSGAAALRRAADRRGLGTGAFGRGLYRQRVLVRVLIALGAAALILLVRPLSAPLIVWTLVVAAILLGILELLQRPGDADDEADDAVVV